MKRHTSAMEWEKVREGYSGRCLGRKASTVPTMLSKGFRSEMTTEVRKVPSGAFSCTEHTPPATTGATFALDRYSSTDAVVASPPMSVTATCSRVTRRKPSTCQFRQLQTCRSLIQPSRKGTTEELPPLHLPSQSQPQSQLHVDIGWRGR